MAKLLRSAKCFSTNLRHCHHDAYRRALASIPSAKVTVAENNMKIATQTKADCDVTTVGLFIDAGSRYEDAKTNGVGNLLQRMLFKGTAKRTRDQLMAEIANLGGYMKSHISRDRIVIYAGCLNKDVPKLVEIISDLVQNPKLSAEDLEEVRRTVLQELLEPSEIQTNRLQYMQDLAYDYLHSTAYQGTPLAQNVSGPTENIASLKASDLKYYLDKHLIATRVVLAASGGLQHNELCQLADQHFSKLDNTFDGEPPVSPKCRYTGSEVRYQADTYPFAHVALAVEGPAWNSPDHIPMMIAKAAFGSYDRTLGHKHDEKSPYHFCHSYEAFNFTYSDTSLHGVYFVCEPNQCDDAATAVLKGWKRFSLSATDAELDTAKKQLIYKTLKELDSPENSCLHIGNSLLTNGKAPSAADLEDAIAKTSNNTVRDTIDKYTNNKCYVMSGIGPIKNLPLYPELRMRMWWGFRV